VSDEFQNWRDRLAGKDVPTHSDRADPGYYKVRAGRDGPWQPCAIWYRGDELVCRVGSEARDPLATWTYAVKNPIAKDVAKFAFDNGYFPDEPKPVAMSNAHSDPYEQLKAEILDKVEQAQAALAQPVETQMGCDLLRNLQAGLLALNKKADAMHREEKAPVLERAKTVDDRFRFRETVADVATKLRGKFEAFLRAEERRQRDESERKFREEQARVAAERARIEAEQAKLKADDPVAFHTSPEPELPELPLAPEPVKVSAGGGFGRKTGLKTDWAPEITDYKLAALHVIEHDDVRTAVEKVIARMVKAAKGKVQIPGVAVQTVRKAA
jgi:hypothetical protein